MQRKNTAIILLITALILLVPFASMQFSDEVDWDLTDFVIMGVLLAGTGLLYELASSKASNGRQRAAIGAALLAALLLVWAELAVGII